MYYMLSYLILSFDYCFNSNDEVCIQIYLNYSDEQTIDRQPQYIFLLSV